MTSVLHNRTALRWGPEGMNNGVLWYLGGEVCNELLGILDEGCLRPRLLRLMIPRRVRYSPCVY